MPFQPGNKLGGRVKGSPNKISGGVKQNIIGVFDKIGGRDEMAKWARENQTEFYKLYGRLAPTEIGIDPDNNKMELIHKVT